MKIHAKLKIQTIVSRLNKKFGYRRYYIDKYGALYAKIDGAYHWQTSVFLVDKEDFIKYYS